MAKQKILNFVSLGLNLSLFSISIICFILKFVNHNIKTGYISSGWANLKFFTNLSNLLLGVVSGIMVPFLIINIIKGKNKLPTFLMILKLVCVTSVFLVFLVVVFALIPAVEKAGYKASDLFLGPNLFYHAISPIFAFLSFSILEVHGRIKLPFVSLTLLPVLSYSLFYLLNVEFKWVAAYDSNHTAYYDWYQFFADGTTSLIWKIVLILFSTLFFGFLAWSLNRCSRHLFYGYDENEGKLIPVEKDNDDYTVSAIISDEEIITDKVLGKVGDEHFKKPFYNVTSRSLDQDYDEITETYTTNTGTIHTIVKKVRKVPSKKTTTTTSLKIQTTTESIELTENQVYHISPKHFSHKWQVSNLDKNLKPKLFDTRKEAIEYSKNLVLAQGGTIRLHSWLILK